MASFEPVLEVLRGGRVEAVHHGAVAVADRAGRLVAWAGDPDLVAYLRSSAKPLQALPLVESGAADAYRLTPRQLALVCASHSGTPGHLAVVESIQRAAGIGESELQCGVHFPYDAAEARRMRGAGEAPRLNHNNCSGKHSGMLALARHLGASRKDYLRQDHPVQRAILEAVADMTDVPLAEVGLGIDGCSAPNFAVPLRGAATAFARLAEPVDLPEIRSASCRRIFQAMTSHPEDVAGPGTFDTALTRSGEGAWIAKSGAEGYQAVGVKPGVLGENSPGLGVVVKIADGDAARRAVGPVMLATLQQLGAEGRAAPLHDEFGPRALQNLRGFEVGETRVVLRLTRA